MAFWALPFLLAFIAAKAWGREKVVGGLLLAAFLLGAVVKPFPLGWLMLALGFFSGLPLKRAG